MLPFQVGDIVARPGKRHCRVIEVGSGLLQLEVVDPPNAGERFYPTTRDAPAYKLLIRRAPTVPEVERIKEKYHYMSNKKATSTHDETIKELKKQLKTHKKAKKAELKKKKEIEEYRKHAVEVKEIGEEALIKAARKGNVEAAKILYQH